MAKDKAEKKEKKEKKHRHSDTNGVTKSEKKEKKHKHKSKSTDDPANTLVKVLEEEPDNPIAVPEVNGDDKKAVVPLAALVPFANPLAEEIVSKKVLKMVKKSAKVKTLKRGVKEVVKSLRKTPVSGPSSSASGNPPGVVILAADISPMDVISHIPVLCEDANVPYLYVTSRAELGAAGATKRPTSVVMVAKDRGKKKDQKVEGDEDWEDNYAHLVKVVRKAGAGVKI